MKYKLTISLLIFWLFFSFSQEKEGKSLYYNDKEIVVVLKDLEKQFEVKFSYPSELVKNIKINLEKQKRTLDDVLFEITYLTNIQFNRIDNKYIYLTKINSEKLEEVVVQSFLTYGISKNSDATFTLNPNKQGLLAGLTETDILESIQQLPGVVSADETATGLIVRGGNSDQNRVVWDNINIYHGGHLFGMVSVFNPNVAQNIRFHNKGTNAKFGERISSVIDISTGNNIIKKPHFEFGLNGISSDVFFSTPLIKDKLSVQLSFRRSYEDLIETKTFKTYEEKAFQNTKIVEEKFHFKDYNGKINYKLNKNNELYFSLIHIDNDLENDYNEEQTNYFDFLDSENEGLSLSWNKKWNKLTTLKTFISYSNYSFYYEAKEKKNDVLLSNFTKLNNIKDLEFSSILSWELNKLNLFDIGYQYNSKQVDFEFKEEKDILYILDQDDSIINTHALFVNYYLKNTSLGNVYLGLRTNYYSELEKIKFEPRLVIHKNLNDFFKLQITGEIKNQIINQIDETVLSSLALENKIWQLADGKEHPIINSKQLSSNLLFTKNNWTLDLDMYVKKTNGITALSLGFLNPVDNKVHIGEQKVKGLDLYLKRSYKDFKIWMSYSFLDAENKFEDLNSNQYFTASNEIEQSFSSAINYTKNKFNFVLGWKYRKGKPLTDLDYDNDGNAYFHGINTEYLPDYHRLDFSSTFRFNFSKKNKIKAKVGVSVRNIYNNKSLISTHFTGNNAIDDPIRVIDHYAIGFTPNFMLRVYW
jgi:hypothetical protein